MRVGDNERGRKKLGGGRRLGGEREEERGRRGGRREDWDEERERGEEEQEKLLALLTSDGWGSGEDPGDHVARGGMDKARGATDGEGPLAEGGELAPHGDEAVLLLLNVRHLDVEGLQASLEPVLEVLEPHDRLCDQRRLLEEDFGGGEGHGVEERRELVVALLHLWAPLAVVVGPVHEEHLVEGERVALNLCHDAVGALVAGVQLLIKVYERMAKASGIDDHRGAQIRPVGEAQL